MKIVYHRLETVCSAFPVCTFPSFDVKIKAHERPIVLQNYCLPSYKPSFLFSNLRLCFNSYSSSVVFFFIFFISSTPGPENRGGNTTIDATQRHQLDHDVTGATSRAHRTGFVPMWDSDPAVSCDFGRNDRSARNPKDCLSPERRKNQQYWHFVSDGRAVRRYGWIENRPQFQCLCFLP